MPLAAEDVAPVFADESAMPEAMTRHYAELNRYCLFWRYTVVGFFVAANYILILLLQDMNH